MRTRRTPLIAPLSLLLLVACGDAPQKLTRAEVQAEGGGEGFDVPGELPPNHPPIGGQSAPAGPAALAGEVELAGELAKVERGSVFLVGRQPGAPASLVGRYDAKDFERLESGDRRLRFQLNQMHPMASGTPSALEFEVYFDVDGIVDTTGDVLARAKVPAQYGDQRVKVRLDDSTRTDTPLPGN